MERIRSSQDTADAKRADRGITEENIGTCSYLIPFTKLVCDRSERTYRNPESACMLRMYMYLSSVIICTHFFHPQKRDFILFAMQAKYSTETCVRNVLEKETHYMYVPEPFIASVEFLHRKRI